MKKSHDDYLAEQERDHQRYLRDNPAARKYCEWPARPEVAPYPPPDGKPSGQILIQHIDLGEFCVVERNESGVTTFVSNDSIPRKDVPETIDRMRRGEPIPTKSIPPEDGRIDGVFSACRNDQIYPPIEGVVIPKRYYVLGGRSLLVPAGCQEDK